MGTDLSDFHEAFFEESFEAVDAMESGLLILNSENYDSETINTIFRGAHSIKGCSATFGFKDIADFVHVKETLLDKMRSGILKPTQPIIDVLLKSIDTLRMMLSATRDGNDYNRDEVAEFTHKFKIIIDSNSTNTEQTQFSQGPDSGEEEADQWHIVFAPHLDIMKTGNDPLRMFNVLQKLGALDCKVNTSELLNFRTIDPEDCYLSWDITLTGNTTRSEIEEIFDWVVEECDLAITPVIKPDPTKNETIDKHINKVKDTPVKIEKEKSATSSHADSSSIRVGIDKVDAIINLVGELVITQSMLDQLSDSFQETVKDTSHFEKLRSGLIQLERNTRELQESVMRIRMLPISYVFNRVPRIAHDLTKKLGKAVNIKMSGENTELDKTVLEKIGDPIIHLIRNAMDHGIETPKQRKALGKPEAGIIYLNAFHKGGNIIIEIRDDGAGLCKQKIKDKAVELGLIDVNETLADDAAADMIFHAGFSTADKVSDVSGRGVGMDVVKKNIKSLGGSIEVKSQENVGTTFTIRLPLTLAILDGQLVRVGDEIYIIPLISIIESLQIKPEHINRIAGQSEVYKLRNEYVPFVRVHDLFGICMDNTDSSNNLMVIVEGDGKRAGLVVDELLEQQQVVIKSLETNYHRIDGLSGATILGDGTVALIVDVTGLIALANQPTISTSFSRSNHRSTQTATV